MDINESADELTSGNSVEVIAFLRLIQQHHVHLSSMADQKAGLLIGGGFVSTSIIAASGTFMYSTTVFGGLMAAATFLAIYAVAPRFGTHRTEDASKGTQLMFFGEFCRLERADYVRRMQSIIKSNPAMFRNMIEDIYSLGQVLYNKKYRYLTWSYRVFMAAIVLGPLIWYFEVILFGDPR